MIPDERIFDTVKSCCQLSPDGPVQEGDRDKLAAVAQPEWSCWKTGIELSCFGVKLLRICELEEKPFFGAPGQSLEYGAQLSNGNGDGNENVKKQSV